MINDSIKIETERLILRPLQLGDFEDYCDLLLNEAVYIWLGNRKKRTPKQIEKLIEYFNENLSKNGYGVLGVISKETGKLIGHAGTNYIESLDKIEYLYALNQNEWNKGYATEIGRVYLEYFKQKFQYNELIALAYPENKRSSRVLRKLGFKHMGKKEIFGNELDYYELDL